MRQEVYTKDTVIMEVNAVMYFSFNNIQLAVYQVDDLPSAISNTAQTQLKEAFGRLSFTEALASQQEVNENMNRNFSARFHQWGITVHRIELQDMKPKGGTNEGMKKQMIAERERRGDFIRAEGNKAARKLASEGTKIVKYNMGLAEQDAARKRSEGEKDSKVKIAKAEKNALDVITSA
ncbi:unnamed protein product, partial [Symbiodinium sp. KB8]